VRDVVAGNGRRRRADEQEQEERGENDLDD
jgi:hypothetical protein